MTEEKSCCDDPGADVAPASIASHDQRAHIRQAYAQVAQANNAGLGCGTASSCCGVADDMAINALISNRLGYTQEDLDQVPAGADMGLGCGNPKAIADLKPGEVVVDLGCGGGFDCFLAAREVGRTGYVIGVDMTPDMLGKARNNAVNGKYDNVEFRLGEIEHLPIADGTADVIISNCVINLSPDKAQVFRDAYRVLKPGGRLAISDVVATVALPKAMRDDAALIANCVGNASPIDALEGFMAEAGFTQISIQPKQESREFIRDWVPGRGVEDYVLSATIEAVKPTPVVRRGCCG